MTLISFYFLYCSLLSLGTFYQINENSGRLIQERRQERLQRRAYHQLLREISVVENQISQTQALVEHLSKVLR